jgi:hypothetical protein
VRYSELAFSVIQDRSVAISGLEKRLIRTFKTVGGYGIFECYLSRGLLWQRAGDVIRRINSIPGRKVPSWSWMAYAGEITYMEIPFGGVDWTDEIHSPFSDKQQNQTNDRWEGRVANAAELRAVAREFIQDCGELIYDEPDKRRQGKLRCVVVGKQRMKMINEHRKHYILIIIEAGRDGDHNIYERVAVGCIEGRHISFETTGASVIIQ